jgi:hypothetical protein
MTVRGVNRSGRSAWCVGLLVTVIFLLPPLVRATGHPLSARDTSSSFRLNRAFDKPAPKQTLHPPVMSTVDRTVSEPSPLAPSHWNYIGAAVRPAHQHRPSVDPRRGPPVRLTS